MVGVLGGLVFYGQQAAQSIGRGIPKGACTKSGSRR